MGPEKNLKFGNGCTFRGQLRRKLDGSSRKGEFDRRAGGKIETHQVSIAAGSNYCSNALVIVMRFLLSVPDFDVLLASIAQLHAQASLESKKVKGNVDKCVS